MPNRVQVLRSNTAGNRPPAGQAPGSIYVNWADRQLGSINGTGANQDLIAVRFYSTGAFYAVGDLVAYNGALYQAVVPASPGAFNPVNWSRLGTLQDLANYLPLTGGTLTGPLALPAAPTAASQAANKSYVDAGDATATTVANTKVPLAGGTMTGLLTLSGAPTAAGHAATKSYVDTGDALSVPLAGGTMTGPLVLPGAPTAANQAATKGYVDSGAFLPLTGGTLTGQLNGTVGNFSSNVYGTNFLGSGSVYPSYNVNTTSNLNSSATAINMVFNGSNYVSAQSSVVYLVAAGGSCSFNGSTFTVPYLTSNNNITVAGSAFINAALYVYAAPSGNNYVLSGNSSQRILQWSGGWYQYWATSGGATFWINNSGNAMSLDGPGNLVLYNGAAYKPGGGAWAATSDDRTKQNVEPYQSGLDQILQLEPIAFQYNGLGQTPNDGKTYYGLSAQSTQPIMPELVHSLDEPKESLTHPGEMLAREEDILPGQLATDLGSLPLALVNAIKTLAARVEYLEAMVVPR